MSLRVPRAAIWDLQACAGVTEKEDLKLPPRFLAWDSVEFTDIGNMSKGTKPEVGSDNL